MAVPAVGAVAKVIAKKLIADILTDPGKIVKYVLLFIVLPLTVIILLLALPFIFVVSLPSLLISWLFGGSATDPAIVQQQEYTIAYYQNAPVDVNNSTLQWIEDKKVEYSGYDDIQVRNSFNLSWKELMAIDTVLLNQDFTLATYDGVLNIAKQFLVQGVKTETYQVQEEYQEEEEYQTTESYYDSQSKTWKTRTVTKTRMVTKTRTVTKNRAIISVSTKSFYDVIGIYFTSQEDIDIVTNVYNNLIGFDLDGQVNTFDPIDLSNLKEYPPGSSNLPYFNQTDKRWGAEMYGSDSIASSACGPTSLAMVIAGLTGKSDINPKVIADWSVANGHRAEGAGSYWSLMTAGGAYYGLTVTQVCRQDPETIVQALSQGYPVIVSMGRGHFTNGGHFIVLRGITADGKILVHDPASVTRSEQEWDLGIIMNESSTNGGVNGSPFWIFKP